MSYKITVQYENGIFISSFGTETLRGEEFDQYLRDIIDLNVAFDRQGRTQIYHILLIDSPHLDFEGMLRALTSIRQNKEMAELRQRLQSVSIMVTTSPVMSQFIEMMLANSTASGRRMVTFPTLEAALAYIRFEQSQQSNAPAEDSATD